MKEVRVAKRYAAALFGIAVRDEIVDSVTADLALVERLLQDVSYLKAVLNQPTVSQSHKDQVATDAFGDRVTATTLSFLKLLIRKRREDLIGDCAREFRMLVAERDNTAEATVSSAISLTTSQTETLRQSLEHLTGKRVHLTTQLDTEMLGGVVVRMGDTIIDGSLRGRLLRLEQQLLGQRLPGDAP
jgi:F-type H+-transporting ATPase subunit delta